MIMSGLFLKAPIDVLWRLALYILHGKHKMMLEMHRALAGFLHFSSINSGNLYYSDLGPRNQNNLA